MRHLSTASEGAEAMSQEPFRARLDELIDLSHPLAKLARVMPWAEIDVAVSATLPPAPVGAGRPALPIRLMAGLLHLKHAYNLSDEATCERWLESCYWQYFTGGCISKLGCPVIRVPSRAGVIDWARRGWRSFSRKPLKRPRRCAR